MIDVKHTHPATLDAEAILFELEAHDFADLRGYTPPALDALPGQTAVVTVASAAGGAIDPADDLPSVVLLQVEMQWKDRAGRTQRILLHTLRGDYR